MVDGKCLTLLSYLLYLLVRFPNWLFLCIIAFHSTRGKGFWGGIVDKQNGQIGKLVEEVERGIEKESG
jgi:hypothetical protein